MIILRKKNIYSILFYYVLLIIINFINITPTASVNITHLNQRFKNVYNAVKLLNSNENKDYDYYPIEEPPPVLVGGSNPNSNETIIQQTATATVTTTSTPSYSAVTPDLEYLTINLNQNNGPQSFSILMNFQNDGTSSYQFINDKYALMTAMSGRCAIGEM